MGIFVELILFHWLILSKFQKYIIYLTNYTYSKLYTNSALDIDIATFELNFIMQKRRLLYIKYYNALLDDFKILKRFKMLCYTEIPSKCR